MKAYIFIVTKPGTSQEVVKAITKTRKVKGVVTADSVYGRFDAIVVVDVDNVAKMSSTIYKVIESIPNVIHTETALTVF